MFSYKTNTELRCAQVGPNTTLIKVNWNKSATFQFSMDPEQKKNMFYCGHDTAKYKDNTEYIHLDGIDELLSKLENCDISDINKQNYFDMVD
jgi:hypothetical protein